MIRFFGRAFGAWATFGLLTATLLAEAGCSDLASDASSSSSEGPEGVGSVRLALTAGTTVAISTATYTIMGPAAYSRTGVLNATGGGALSGLIGGIPTGTGFDIALDGTSTDGSVTCSGSATFDIVTHTTTAVEVPLVCREVLSGGSASVSDTTNVCPVVDGVAAAPMAAPSAGSIVLTGTAHDKDNGPQPLAYQWTATAGTFSDATAQNPTFVCPTTTMTTTVTITLTVTDGGPGCSDSMPLTVTCG
jgi:hypothetical protein